MTWSEIETSWSAMTRRVRPDCAPSKPCHDKTGFPTIRTAGNPAADIAASEPIRAIVEGKVPVALEVT